MSIDEKRMREAIGRRAGIDLKMELVAIYKGVKRGKIKTREFVEIVEKLTGL